MQISMKPTRKERTDLERTIRQARKRSRLTNAALADLAKVDPSQVSRICRGDFRTISDSVVRICTALKVPITTRAASPGVGGPSQADETPVAEIRTDAAWARLEKSVRKVWDRTPQGADRLARVLEAAAEVRRG
jgi:transcriptional regulator with XRE-family HTH domain